MSCTNCYNGCVQTTPDKCVRYTGVDSVALGIENGDNLFTVEQILISNVVSFLDGSGIDITIAPDDYCTLVTANLPVGRIPTSVELFRALVKAACSLQTQITAINASLVPPTYTVGCLTGVTSTSTTAQVLQATINKLCSLSTDVTALTTNLYTNYVRLADLNSLIAAYLDSVDVGTQQYTKMVPYTVVEYYGSLSNFSASGAGLFSAGWDKIFLCNGLNGTPDKRGRVGVGAIAGVPGGALDPAVNPATVGNPNWALNGKDGHNTIALTIAQMPTHSHTATVVDPGHHHFAGNTPEGWSSSGSVGIVNRTPYNIQTTTSTTGITVNNTSTGSGANHDNYQPGIACYYIMYIPS